jgi:hypothetical protein
MSSTVRFPLRDDPYLKGLKALRVPYVAVIEDALPHDVCDQLVQRIEQSSPTVAPISVAGGAVLDIKTRNNERVMFEDVGLAAHLFAQTRAALPATLEGGTAVGYNERFRGYRYRVGQRFAPHFDGAYFRPPTGTGREESLLTVLFYLNDGFEGGETKILDWDVVVVPKKGSALVFTHAILHEGCAVSSGAKYVLRTDAMYRFEGP